MKKSTKISNDLFLSILPMTFLKTEKICFSNIMGQNLYNSNAKLTNSICLVENRYSIPPGVQVAKSNEKVLINEITNPPCRVNI